MRNILSLIVVLLILIGLYWLIGGAEVKTKTADLGTYAYACDNGAEFNMTPAPDVSSIRITPSTNAAFAETTLASASSSAGARFEGDGVVFVGAGEGVTITTASTTINCQPKPNPDSPPWNWGDAGEGGGVKQDVGLIVSESIVGKWQSTDDAKFIREFKDGGAAVDTYEGKNATSGTWKVFTKEKPITVPFPLESDAVYIQMTIQGAQAENLNFKLGKLTPEELELVYMDRGGTLKFKSVK